MEEEDEFGDLYTDVLLPASAPPPPPLLRSSVPVSIPPSDPLIGSDDDGDGDDDRILYCAPRSVLPLSPSSHHPQTLAPVPEDDKEDDWLVGRVPVAVEQPENWDDEEEEVAARPLVVPAADLPAVGEPGVLEEEREDEARASDGDADVAVAGGVRIPEENGEVLLGGEGAPTEMKMDDPYQELAIPGISSGPLSPGPSQAVNGRDLKASGSDDWDSDSEDDLQIVLNDSNPAPLGGERNDGGAGDDDDDEDGEVDLVIVTDADQPRHHHQAVEEQEWGEEAIQATVDGERKETPEAGKTNSTVGNTSGARIGGFHPQHHAMYKYTRPGAGPVPGGPVVGAIGGSGQIRPSPTLGSLAGRGRGDWRPAGYRGVSGAQRSFSSGYGLPGWVNSSSGRAFGSGFDFTLPSHKTIFEIDIEGFEEKPWRHPGADISDFFNFGLDEDNWKDYCKLLEQLRLEASMQSKISVYESGRSEQDYDPDLPPELAAAAGHHDNSADNVHHCKTDNGNDEFNGEGKGAVCMRTPLPIGRSIQVEVGYGERLPSTDTRPPRMRDSDAIIEIVLHGSLDEQPEKDLQGDLRGVHDFVEDDRQAVSEHFDRLPHTFNGRKREMVARNAPLAPERDGILPFPSESPLQYHPSSKLRSPVNIGRPFGKHPGGRLPKETSRGRRSSTSAEHSFDAMSARSAQVNRHDNRRIEKPGDSTEGNQTSEASPILAVEASRDLSLDQRDGEHDDRLALGDDSIEVGEDLASDFQETPDDDRLIRSAKKRNLCSRVEQPAYQDNGGDDDLRATNSDNSRAKSGSSKDYQKRHEGGEEIQDGRLRRVGDSRELHEGVKRNLPRKDEYGRDGMHGIERNRINAKGREAMYHLHPHRGRDSNTAHAVRGRNEGFERPKEIDGITSRRQRREEDTHRRRVKDDDASREHNEEARSRNMNKAKVSDRSNKDDGVHLKKQIDDGDWRNHHREGGPRQRDKDGVMMRRREVDDPPRKRKEEEHSGREKADKEDTLNGYRAREDSIRRKRERDDGQDHRREDDRRTREKVEDRHSTKHKDDSWRQREREERPRLKQPHEDLLRHHEREERGGMRNGRATEDKPLAGNGKNKDSSKDENGKNNNSLKDGNVKNKDSLKDMVSDKDNHHRDRRQHNEQSKSVNQVAEGNNSQNKGREDVHAREKQSDNEERSSRRERLSNHGDRPSNASDSQQMHRDREKHRENTRKSKDIEVGEQNPQGSTRKKSEDNTQRNEKVRLKGTSEQESNRVSSMTLSKKGHHQNNEQSEVARVCDPSGKLGEEDPDSDDENQKGRSKLERWTSQKERDYSAVVNIQPFTSTSRVEVKVTEPEMVLIDESVKTEVNDAIANDSDPKGADTGQFADRMGEDQDRHLDTVAKLKRRSERFKLPLLGEKDMAVNKKMESEEQLTSQDEASAEMEIKPERPARKRRWTSS